MRMLQDGHVIRETYEVMPTAKAWISQTGRKIRRPRHCSIAAANLTLTCNYTTCKRVITIQPLAGSVGLIPIRLSLWRINSIATRGEPPAIASIVQNVCRSA
jgi:hypothetical protein